MCLHSARSPHIPCYFPRSHSKSAKHYLIHFTRWAEQFEVAAQYCRAKPQPFLGSSKCWAEPQWLPKVWVQCLGTTPHSNANFIIQNSYSRFPPVIQMYSKFPEKQKGVTADLRCCHILSSMQEGSDLEAWTYTFLRCNLEPFNSSTNLMAKSSRVYSFIFYFLCFQTKHRMRSSFLVSCANLLKFLQSPYGDFQIQILSVPEWSLMKHYVLESTSSTNHINHI